VGLPVIDIRDFEAKKTAWRWNFFTMMQYAPYMSILIVLLFCVFALASLSAVYIPQYQSYQSACVQRTQDGTVVTRNANSFAYNYAASTYNNRVGKELAKYDADRSQKCALFDKNSTQAQNEAITNLISTRNAYNNSAYQLSLFDQCVNRSKPDFPTLADLARWNINTTAWASDPLEVLVRAGCANSTNFARPEGLANAVFNCSLLPTCILQCDGPDKAALYQATYESGCQSEWLIHAGMFRLALSILVYICLNVSRLLIMLALTRLCWRTITNKGFEFTASCNRLGEFTQETQLKLRKATDTAIRQFEGVAWVYLVLALVVHLPYIIILSAVGSGINQATSQQGSD